jgi:endogenous inhibitor of DNA gyrase (YacG/DUF329 family)
VNLVLSRAAWKNDGTPGSPANAGPHFGLCAQPRRVYFNRVSEAPAKPCPICRKPAAGRFRPFCSARCKDVDLHRWFSGAYAIPAVESEDDSEEQEPFRERRSD